MGIIRWFKNMEEERIKDEKIAVDKWNKDQIKFKSKFRCVNCANIFPMRFRDGETISSHQHWTGHYSYLNSDCPDNRNGFIRCPLCNRDECLVINTTICKQKSICL